LLLPGHLQEMRMRQTDEEVGLGPAGFQKLALVVWKSASCSI
jgi:hypothetical protein